MKYFFDTEFIEDGKTVDLISIGIVAEDGREFYSQCIDTDLSRAHPWVQENVLPHLEDHIEFNLYSLLYNYPRTCYKSEIAGLVGAFCDPVQYGKPEFWGYYADYDWVVLCQLFGTMMDLPKDWPMYCRDLKQLCDMYGNPKLPEQGKGEHHALADAKWNKLAYDWLTKTYRFEAYTAVHTEAMGYWTRLPNV